MAGRSTSDAYDGLLRADPHKALVMNHLRQLVADGYAEWGKSEDGDVRLRFHTGETFILADTVIVRVA